jgi:uncharacterized protein
MPDRPQPRFPEPNTEAYWEAAKTGQLTYQTCNDCNTVIFTPRVHCTGCGGNNLKANVSKGEGKIYTYTVVRQNRNPAFSPLGAYVLAWIDLDEGFRMLSNVVGVANPTTDVKCDARVKVDFEKQDTGEYPIPVFRLA